MIIMKMVASISRKCPKYYEQHFRLRSLFFLSAAQPDSIPRIHQECREFRYPGQNHDYDNCNDDFRQICSQTHHGMPPSALFFAARRISTNVSALETASAPMPDFKLTILLVNNVYMVIFLPSR